MATPAAILTVLVRAQGAGAAAAELNAVNAAGTKAAAGGLAKSEKAAMGAGAAYKSAAKHVAAFVGAYVGFKAVEKSVETTDALAKTTMTLSKNYGLATKKASEWAAVAKSRDLDGKQLTMGFKSLSKQVQAAGDGSKKAVEEFKLLGVSQKDLAKHGDNLDWVLRRVSDGIAKIPPGTTRAAIQGTLFGRTWQTVSPIIRNGSKAMEDQLKIADKYGATFTGKSLKGVEEFVMKQREAKLANIGLQIALGTTFIPILTKVVTAFAQFVAQFREGEGTAGKVRDRINDVVRAMQPFVQSVQQIVGWLSKQGEAGKIIIGVLAGVAAGIWAVNAAMSANPATLFVAAIAAVAVALVTAYRESATFRSVLDTLANAAVAAGQAIAGAFMAALPTLKTIGQTALGVGQAVVGAFVAVGGALVTAGSAVVHEVSQWGPLFHFLGAIVTAVVGVVKSQLAVLVALVKVTTALLGPAFAAAWSIVRSVTSAAWSYITGVVRGGLLALRGIIKIIGGLFKGDFGQIWDGIKDIFRGGITVLRGILAGAWKILKAPVDAIGAGLKDAFTKTWGRVSDVFSAAVGTIKGFVNAIIDVINVLPFVNLKHVGASVGATPTSGANTLRPPSGGQNAQRLAEGGKVNAPVAIMGEEAPRHPEWVIPTNPAYRRRAIGLWAKAAGDLNVPGFALGGLHLPNPIKAASGAANFLGKLPGKVANTAAGLAGFVLGKLPHNPFGKGIFHDMAAGVLAKGGEWIKNAAGKVWHVAQDALGGGKSSRGPDGVGAFMGIPMANWVIDALRYAQSKGVKVRPTSGYRPGFDPHTASGRSEHQGTRYPHGAVDFGGYHDPAALAMKMAVVGATRNFKYPLLAPVGFVDDGHASGTGHKKGGLLRFKYGGKFIAGLAKRAGFPDSSLDIATAIALAESGGDPKVVSKTGDYGLWQINRAAHPGYFKTPGKIFDPDYNAHAAYVISDHGKNWGPWSTYRSGAYKGFLGSGGTAVAPARVASPMGKIAGGGKTVTGGGFPSKTASTFGFVGSLGHPNTGHVTGNAMTGISGTGVHVAAPTPATPIPNLDDFYGSMVTLAKGTPGIGDDQKALLNYLSFAQSGLAKATANKDYSGIQQFSGTVDTITQSLHDLPLTDMQKAFDTIDLHARALDITGAQAKQQKIDALTQAINTGTYNGATLDADQILELRADLEDLKGTVDAQTAATQALADATAQQAAQTKALTDEMAKNNAFAGSVAGIGQREAIKAFADVISGQIMGPGYSSRALSASAGQTVRY